VVVIVEGNGTEDIVVLVDGVAKVASLLLVKVFAVGVAVLWFLGAGVNEAAVLCRSVSQLRPQCGGVTDHVGVDDIEELGLGESCPALGELG
jgi:hypothetical protein